MRSLLKFYIMWIYNALSAVPSCTFPIGNYKSIVGITLNLKKICVQSVMKKRTFSYHFSGPRNFILTNVDNKMTGHLNMLNVQLISSKPLYSFMNICLISNAPSSLLQVTTNFSRAFSTVATRPSPGVPQLRRDDDAEEIDSELITSLTTTSMEDMESEDEETMDEMKREAIWSVGPTPPPSFSFGTYANQSNTIQQLADLGVNLAWIENKIKEAIPLLIKSDFEKDIAPVVRFLEASGVYPTKIGWFLTKNPFILIKDLDNLEKRLEYLRLKKFSQEAIERIINTNPHWLSYSVTQIDKRLGFFQSYFRLSGAKVRELATRGPKLITTNIMTIKRITDMVKEEMGFTREELVKMLLEKPRIWKEDPTVIWRRFDYLHNCIKFPHEAFVLCPELLLVRESRLKHRIGYLQHVGRAQFDPEQPNYVSFKMIYEGDDSHFALKVAKSSVLEFNQYLKTL